LAKPFLKWAGSKQKLVASLERYMPKDFGTYYEPFLGSASVFFHLGPTKAVLSDTNRSLIATYEAVRDNPTLVQAHIDAIPTDRDTYYEVRSRDARGRDQRAADFIYLNKLCWNGLYRVNLQGRFNVPYGANKNGAISTVAALRDCAVVLNPSGVTLKQCDFADSLKTASSGDLAFIDPPYVTSHNNNGFIEYNEDIFSWRDQVRLAKLCKKLVDRGVTVVVTNANHGAVKRLYPDFGVHRITRASTLAGDKSFRRQISEAVLVGRP
jgi:DNA adenine methylase